MTKAIILATALLMGLAFGVPGKMASAEEAKDAVATKKAQCEHEATLQHYAGKQRARFIRKCLASGRPAGKAVAHRPAFHPLDSTEVPEVTPLGSVRSMGATVPSNAPVAPSAPVVGSSGTSTTGSSATSISGSSGTSIGSSGRR
jgi:hypothetical protein